VNRKSASASRRPRRSRLDRSKRRKNPQQSGDILAKCDKIEPAVIAAMARNHYAEQINPALMQPLIMRPQNIRVQNVSGTGSLVQTKLRSF
jgi:hypothetical protein